MKYSVLYIMNFSESDIMLMVDPISILTKTMIKDRYICFYESNVPENVDVNNKANLYEFLENIFRTFNSEDNPLNDQVIQKKIRELKSHTSMSVGDVVLVNNVYYYVGCTGFGKL
jgi:hypothetical protein